MEGHQVFRFVWPWRPQEGVWVLFELQYEALEHVSARIDFCLKTLPWLLWCERDRVDTGNAFKGSKVVKGSGDDGLDERGSSADE